MASEGEFPKADGDILYASEVNNFIAVPRIAASGANHLNFGVTYTGSSYIKIISKGTLRTPGLASPGWATGSAMLYLNGTQVDIVNVRGWDNGPTSNYAKFPFSLLHNTILPSGTHSVGISGMAALHDTKIIVEEVNLKY